MTVQNLYTQYLDGKITKQKFLYEVRRDQNLDMISPNNSFDDVVKILKNKSIISEKAHKEAKESEGKQEVEIIAKTIDMVNPYEYTRGMEFELGIMDVPATNGDLSEDNILKAQKKVLANLTKNPSFYFDKINGKEEVGHEWIEATKKEIDKIGKGKSKMIREGLEEAADTEADKDMVRKLMAMYETEPSKFEKLHKQAQTQAATTTDIKFKHLASLFDRAKAGALQSLSNQDRFEADREGVDEATEFREEVGGNLMLNNAAKQIYQYIKKNGFPVSLVTDKGQVIGDPRPSFIVSTKIEYLTKFDEKPDGLAGLKQTITKIGIRDGGIYISGLGSNTPVVKDKLDGLQSTILSAFNFLEKSGEVMIGPSGGGFAVRIKPDMLKKGQVTEATRPGYHADGTPKSNDEMSDDEREAFYNDSDFLDEHGQYADRVADVNADSSPLKEKQEAIYKKYSESTGIPMENLMAMVREAKAKMKEGTTYAGKDAVDDATKDPKFGSLSSAGKTDAINKLKQGNAVTIG